MESEQVYLFEQYKIIMTKINVSKHIRKQAKSTDFISPWREFKKSFKGSTQSLMAYVYIKENGKVCQRQFEKLSDIRPTNITRIFYDLERLELIEKTGLIKSPITGMMVNSYMVK